MKPPNRTQLLSGILVATLIVAAIVLVLRRPPERPAPNAPGYYTGPKLGKGDSKVYATEDGKIVDPPPEAANNTTAKPEGEKSGTMPAAKKEAGDKPASDSHTSKPDMNSTP